MKNNKLKLKAIGNRLLGFSLIYEHNYTLYSLKILGLSFNIGIEPRTLDIHINYFELLRTTFLIEILSKRS